MLRHVVRRMHARPNQAQAGNRRAATGFWLIVFAVLGVVVAACRPGSPSGGPPIVVGMIGPLSGDSAASGEAVQRGMLLAMEEINREGGVLGRQLELVARDVHNDPPAGVTALRDMASQNNIVALFGNKWSPVMLAQVDLVHELQVPFINPGGALTAIVRNGRNPNYAFRVSMSDDEAQEFLARYALEVMGARRPGVVTVANVWGDANASGLADWLARQGTPAAGSERLAEGETNMSRQLERLRAAGADAVILAGSANEGAAVVRGMGALGWKVPVLTTWSVSGGEFVERAGIENTDGVLTLQTFSFYGPLSGRADALLKAYHARFGTRQVEEVLNSVSVAHAYDGVHLLVRAIRAAGTTDGPRVRDALEQLEPYDGVVKRYAPAFTPEDHEALHAGDYQMGVWQGGRLVPAPRPRLAP